MLSGELPQAPFRLIPLKSFGGVLAIGAGLALGPEGPSVQMGASVAHLVGKLFRRDWKDCRVLLGACAGAGFAAACSAPIAGAVFVLEELVGHFETRIAVAALGASAAAIWLGSVIVGGSPVSYASGAPGGLLAPMLVLGSQAGLFVGTITYLAFPVWASSP